MPVLTMIIMRTIVRTLPRPLIIIAWVAEDQVTEHLASGALARVLEDWCGAGDPMTAFLSVPSAF